MTSEPAPAATPDPTPADLPYAPFPPYALLRRTRPASRWDHTRIPLRMHIPLRRQEQDTTPRGSPRLHHR